MNAMAIQQPDNRINATGFASLQSGSVASANAMLLRELLQRGIAIDFFSKPSFVDPRPVVADLPARDRLRLIDCTNYLGDTLRKTLSAGGKGGWGKAWRSFDSQTYNRCLVRRMRNHGSGVVDVWLGDWARGRGARPVVSFAQGPPGTDARSVLRHRSLIQRLVGKAFASKLSIYAKYRLSIGLPRFDFSNQVIVGSKWSRDFLRDAYRVPHSLSAAIPYPIDLEMFRPLGDTRSTGGPLKLLWLGRFAPRKRLDLFLNGLSAAIRNGCDVQATIVGCSDFIPNYEKLIAEFEFPNFIQHTNRISRSAVPQLMWEHDVICQPSDEENFGSSVAEALACGLPAIVGSTNGTADYICERSIVLADDSSNEMASSIQQMAELKRSGGLADPRPSRTTAEQCFNVSVITDKLLEVMSAARNAT